MRTVVREGAKFVLWAVLVFLVVAGIVGCSKRPETLTRPDEMSTCAHTGGGLYDCRLQDGTRCVVLVTGGLQCDFKRGRGPE